MAIVIQIKRGTAASWTAADTVLAVGEMGFETDTRKSKVGDGSTAWTSLSYTVTLVTTDDLDEGEENQYHSGGRVNGILAAGTGLDKNIVDEAIEFSIDSTVATLNDSQTLTNKKLSDSTTSIVDVSDATKVLKFDIAGTTGVIGTISTAFTTDKTITLPDTAGTVALTSGVINNTLTTTTGDTIYASSANTPARLAIGTAAQVLTVNSGATAPEWATAASGSTFVGCVLTKSSAQTISNNSSTAVTFNVELFDTDGFHESGNPSRITIPSGKAGKYLITTKMCFTTSSTGERLSILKLNGALNDYLFQGPGMSGGYTFYPGVAIRSLSVGDYIEFFVTQTSGGALDIVDDPNYTTFTVSYLGA